MHFTEDGTLMMVATNPFTRVVEYDLDTDHEALVPVWSYGEANQEYAFALGDARVMDNGNVWYCGGAARFCREVTRDGDVLWEWWIDHGLVLGNVILADDLRVGERG